MARSTLPGRSLDSGSNVGARGMITLSGSSGETEPGLQTRFRSLFPSGRACPKTVGATGRSPLPYRTLPRRYQATLK